MSDIHIQLTKQKLEKGIQSNKVFLEVIASYRVLKKYEKDRRLFTCISSESSSETASV